MSEAAEECQERFCPSKRGQAARELESSVPLALRAEIKAMAAAAPPATGFQQGAVAVVSTPRATAWSAEVAHQRPDLGPPAGPACIVHLWAAGLLRRGSAFDTYWPSLLRETWNVVQSALDLAGIDTKFLSHRQELQHDVAEPLAMGFLRSLAECQKDLDLIDKECGCGSKKEFGWAPGIDPLRPTLGFLFLGQVPGRFRSHAFTASPFAQAVCAAGFADVSEIRRRECSRCKIWLDTEDDCCPNCHGPLKIHMERRLTPRLDLDVPLEREPKVWSSRGEVRLSPTPVPEQIGFLEIRRKYVRRARGLWKEVIQGQRYGLEARLVLGAFAGVRPLRIILDGLPPKDVWLEILLDTLAEPRIKGRAVAEEVNCALAMMRQDASAAPCPEKILPRHIYNLANHFRDHVFGR